MLSLSSFSVKTSSKSLGYKPTSRFLGCLDWHWDCQDVLTPAWLIYTSSGTPARHLNWCKRAAFSCVSFTEGRTSLTVSLTQQYSWKKIQHLHSNRHFSKNKPTERGRGQGKKPDQQRINQSWVRSQNMKIPQILTCKVYWYVAMLVMVKRDCTAPTSLSLRLC